ncbi:MULTISPECIES: acyltransferase [unclassified Bosea (in: a-proteobacteria)]|uniref:acyltransferase family protein n=1 Tax=unclassified Bosea (in: a-proteobacteria) TaxID=2653178 RepID=UPI0009557BDF|nr:MULTISPECIES: acyltransferase [unclassified Bosea (in: a-proteobacteria)]TAJ30156.1 MAG: acyltransferase [Bosea sp. (in: a-proteobacteria)]SIP93201.1 Peptidoglycan/LPS O-acetylase OafA/YrhL, contains acyltransferase and SGNH-hydrolase domains [Bosea sp. TND4EK4]
MSAAAPAQNQNIQALRAVAALMVVLAHAGHETEALGPKVGRAVVDLSMLQLGAGVDIFFVISGFIMVYTSAGLYGQPGAPRQFLLRRFIRIAPLYWLLTTLLLAGALVAPQLLNVPIGDWQHVLSSYLFIPSLRGGEIRPVMALGWTLNLEMFFYLLFAATLVLPLRSGITALALILSGLALCGALFQPAQVQLAFWTQGIILEFLFGCLLALAYRRGARLKGPAAALAVAVGLAAMVRLPGLDDAPGWPPVLRWGVPALLVVAGAALYGGKAPRIALLLAGLGDASYSLYLVHPFALRPLREVWTRLVGGALPLETYVLCAVGFGVLVALATHRFVERPLLRVCQSWLKRRSDRAGQGSLPAPLRTTA